MASLQDTKDWLKAARSISAELKSYTSLLSDFEARKNYLSAAGIDGYIRPSSPSDPTARHAIDSVSLDELRPRVAKLEAELAMRAALIAAMPDSAHILRALLVARYLEGQRWEAVAYSIGYSYSYTVQRLHPLALFEAAKLLDFKR